MKKSITTERLSATAMVEEAWQSVGDSFERFCLTADSRSRSAVSRRFVELSAARMAEWMSSDLSQLDLLAIQVDGLHIREELTLVGAVGVDSAGDKHPLAVVEGATENAAMVQALLDNLVGRGSRHLPSLHRRWSEGAVEGGPTDLRPPCSDPALPNS